jgi:Fe-S-cluster-containing dehydrogenase component
MIAFDADGCINCRICEDMCSYRFAGVFKPAVSAIRLQRAGRFLKIEAHVCNLCEGLGEQMCVSVCPTEALFLEDLSEGQVVKFDHDQCITCMACVDECPEEAVAFDGDNGHFNICDLCAGDPLCVKWCPENVLWVEGVVVEA